MNERASVALASALAKFGVRGFITAFLSLLATRFWKTAAISMTFKKRDDQRKESGNQLPQSKKWNESNNAIT